ncbi:MAG TPA: chromate efflux transporter [Ferrovibrio sp.]|uniref:chromate efflux transporter n=1 Tax=Ferrovibrio sp. TaxID=1917215 RepID=UPI002B4AFFAE|nr:chromate efflux transporter [Ferrovibrio sp.]HLT77224.1 chromate efflux transporter [Ferrovibrio sp.]
MDRRTTVPQPSFAEALLTWLKVGLLSFGGPAGQIAMMHRIVVDEKKWVSEPQFLHALNFCMLLPGPEAQQLATYVGWLLHRAKGGIAAGLLFILPGLAIILALSTVYVLWREIPLVHGLFFGLQAAVLAIVIEAVQRIAKRALRARFLLLLSMAAFIGIYLLQLPFPLIVLGAALAGWLVGRLRPAWMGGSRAEDDAALLPSVAPSWRRNVVVLVVFGLLWFGPILWLHVMFGGEHVLSRISVFFSEMAVVTFGGAYAVLAYVGQQAVDVYGWLEPGEMLHGLGLAETTPGPLILVLTFVGYLAGFKASGIEPGILGGLAGGVLATWVTFAPCFLWIFLGAPYLERLRGVAALNHALAAITAAVVGVILNLAIWFALHSLFRQMGQLSLGPFTWDIPVWSSLDPAMALLAALSMLALLRIRIGMLWVLAGAGAAGVALKLFA